MKELTVIKYGYTQMAEIAAQEIIYVQENRTDLPIILFVLTGCFTHSYLWDVLVSPCYVWGNYGSEVEIPSKMTL